MENKAKYLFHKIQNKSQREAIQFIQDELKPLHLYIQQLKLENQILRERLEDAKKEEV